MDTELQQARGAVLDVLGTMNEPRSFREVVDDLDQRGVQEDLARVAVWSLIDRQQVQLTRDHKLLRVKVQV